MKNIAIICEYNPFHNGHKYQIEKTREIFGENTNIICIMSGNFVQRGDFAIFDKHTRAKCAILGGANLVFELPLSYAVSSAELFAKGAISVLNSLNCIDFLCFGSECGDIDMLIEVSKAIKDENINETIKNYLKTGISYPNALDKALSDFNKNFGEIIKNPNNTLAIEYINQLILTKSTIKPITITRKNTGYHSNFELDNIASASYIRDNFDNNVLHLIPNECKSELLERNSILTVENSILSYLKRQNADYFKKIRDVNEGLEHKIVKSIKISTSLEELYANIKSKRYTQSRIRRIILNAYLGIEKEFTEISPKYAKVLAFDDNGRKILKNLKKSSQIPIILKPASDYNLCINGKKQFELDILATDLYSMGFLNQNMRISSNELKNSPIYIAT